MLESLKPRNGASSVGRWYPNVQSEDVWSMTESKFWLVVNGCHEFWNFPMNIGLRWSSQLTNSNLFQRGGPTTNQDLFPADLKWAKSSARDGWSSSPARVLCVRHSVSQPPAPRDGFFQKKKCPCVRDQLQLAVSLPPERIFPHEHPDGESKVLSRW